MIPAVPADSVEREFLEYWSRALLDPRDPQNDRWLAIELGQVDRGRRTAREIAAWTTLHGARVLDLGCQTGALAVALAELGAEVVGVDVDGALVEGARIRARCHGARAEFRVGRAEALPFEPASFDAVAMVDVIEHVDDADRALAEVTRVLRPSGVLYLQGPNRFSPRWFLRDPHYQMTGISVLPPALGRFYVTRVRGRPRYDVGVFPVGSRVVRALERRGLSVLAPRVEDGAGVAARARHAMELRFAGMFTVVARR